MWPWAIRQKINRLDSEARAEALEKSTQQQPAPPPARQVIRPARTVPTQLIFPVEGKGLQDIVSFFGDPRAGGSRTHEGVDIAAPRGTPVVAVAGGLVEKVKSGGSGGRQVWLLLDNGWKVYYAHLHTQLVREGVLVKTGDLIGTVGNTGNAQHAGPHLHFCLYPSPNKAVNALLYLPGQLSLP